MHIITTQAGVDLSNPAALNRGEISLDNYYQNQLRVEIALLLQREPNLLLTGWGGVILAQGKVDPSLESLWPSEFGGDAAAFVAAYSFDQSRIHLDCNPMGIGREKAIWLGPIELIRLYTSDQLVLEPGDSIFCAGFSAIMPNDGRRGSIAFQRLSDGKPALAMFERQSLIDDGDRCAAIK